MSEEIELDNEDEYDPFDDHLHCGCCSCCGCSCLVDCEFCNEEFNPHYLDSHEEECEKNPEVIAEKAADGKLQAKENEATE